MEVHHPHHPTHKKNWKEYTTEFIMLFAAVSLGFLAENIREQYVEKERAHELIARFSVDVKNNVYFLDSLLTFNHNMEYQMDSAMIELYNSKEEFDLNFFFNNVKPAFPRFLSKNDTYEQMKSSGSLRYIKDVELLNMMIDYTNETEGTEYRSKEQEASYVLGEYSNILVKWTPTQIAMKSYLKSFDNMKSRILSPDSTISMLNKVNNLKEEKNSCDQRRAIGKIQKGDHSGHDKKDSLDENHDELFEKIKIKGEALLTYLNEHSK